MVYFIADIKSEAIKIGHSNDPKKRLAELRVGNPNELVLAGIMEGDEAEEKVLHERFKDLHIR